MTPMGYASRAAERTLASGEPAMPTRVPQSLLLITAFALLSSSCSDNNLAPPPPDASTVDASITTTTPPQVSQLAVQTNKTYVVVSGGTSLGVTVYTDRTYKTLSLPTIVQGATLIRTANNDKVAYPKSTSFLSFTVDRGVVVYVAHDRRLSVPQWLRSQFTSAGAAVVNSDYYGKQTLDLYRRAFPKGRITLGSNVDVAANGNMYMVIVADSGAATTTVSTPKVQVTAPTSNAVLSKTVTLAATATASAGMSKVTFQLDNKTTLASDASSPYSVSWNSATVSNGTHTVSAIAIDKLGHTAKSSVTVTTRNTTTSSTTPTSGTHSGWYVAPNGSSGGAGTASSPWNLTTALAGAGGRIHPGDTVWMRAGTYGSGGYNQYTSTLTGTASAPIIVRQYPGERATINGFMTVNGGYTTFWGMEFMDSDPLRISHQSGSFATDIPRANYQVTVNGPGTKFVNVVVHDLGNGLAAWESATNAEVYGSLFYNNGWQGTDRAHGHGLYIQNLSGTKLLQDNIVFDNFDYGIQIYSQSTHINNITLDGNIAFNNGTLGTSEAQDIVAGGTENGMQNFVATGNMTYRNDRWKTAKFGLDYGVPSSNGRITGNYFGGMVQLQNWSSLTFTGNTLIGGTPQVVAIELMSGQSFSSYSMTAQQYFEPGSLGISQPFGTVTATAGGNGYTFSDWQRVTGRDAGSSFDAGSPSGQKIVVEPNKYESGRANIAVYNWSHGGAASVDLSSVLKPGDQFEVRNAQNFYGAPAYSGTYAGGTVSIPLPSVAPVAAIGGSPTAPLMTAPTFYAFVVLRTS